MDIDITELEEILPRLSTVAQQEIQIRILERRLEQATADNERLEHHISALQQAIKEQA